MEKYSTERMEPSRTTWESQELLESPEATRQFLLAAPAAKRPRRRQRERK